jgi:hypothetical protein
LRSSFKGGLVYWSLVGSLGLKGILVYSHFFGIVVLSGKHKLFLHHLLFGLYRLGRAWDSTCTITFTFLKLFHSVSISQSVQRMLTTAVSWGDISNHGGFAVSSKGILEHLSELAASEGQMLLLEVQCSDALLKSQKTLVDLCSVHLSLFVSVHCISSSFTTS